MHFKTIMKKKNISTDKSLQNINKYIYTRHQFKKYSLRYNN